MRNQIVPWFGSKAALGPEILPEFGPHKVYFEPFMGGLGMLLRKPRVSKETINDLHLDLTNLARILSNKRDSTKLRKNIAARLCSEQLNREARARLAEPFVVGIDRAADFFYMAWMAKQGVIGVESCNSMAHCYSVKSQTCANRLRHAMASIEAFHERMALVTITNRDAFRLLEQIHDEAGILIYCDPPYVVKNGKYIHDFDPEQHGKLAKTLGRFKNARVVVSYTDHPVLDELYQGWSKKVLDYEARANRGAKVKTVKPREVLFINGPLFGLRDCVPPVLAA